MKPFYSILYCPIRPIVEERLSIALIVRTEDKVYFRFSHDKLKVIKELLPAPAYNLLRTSLNNIDHYIISKGIKNNPNQMLIDGESKVPERFFQKDYFQYLNSYSNNLLHFSEPKSLDLEVDDEIFNNLYWKLVFESDSVADKKQPITAKIKSKVNPKIITHVNIDLELDSKHIKGLIVPTPVWFIGTNGVDVTGEILDFDKQHHFLENDIRQHLFLLTSLRDTDEYKRKGKGKHYFVGKEPKKSDKINHSLWNELRGLKYLDYVSSNETDEITEYLRKQKVSPFIPQATPSEE